jgi:uncharacterized delta-60 repeat protein
MMRPAHLARFAILALCISIGCGTIGKRDGDDGDDGDGPGGEPGGPDAGDGSFDNASFALTAEPQPYLRVGSTRELAIAIERKDGFAGEIEVVVEELPDGVAAAELSLAGDESEGIIALDTAADAPAGESRRAAVMARSGDLEARFEFTTLVIGRVGTLDTSFGEGGVSTDPALASGGPFGVVAQDAGKTVVAIRSAGVKLVRVLDDGTIDESFGTGGVTTIAASTFGVTGSLYGGITAQSDGKIVIAGRATTTYPDNDIVLGRITPDGQLDTTFAGGGAVHYDFGLNTYGYSSNLQIVDDQDRIIVGGSVLYGDNSTDAYLARFTRDGQPDTSFGSGGIAVFAIGNGQYPEAMAAVGGRILIGGLTQTEYPNGAPFLIQCNDAGQPWTSWGTGGYNNLPQSGQVSGQVYAMKANADGSVLVSGSVGPYTGPNNGALWRIKPDGLFDSAFGGGDARLYPVTGGTRGELKAMTDVGGNKVLIGGMTYDGSTYSSVTIGIEPDGQVDSAFGLAVHDIDPAQNEYIHQLVTRVDHRLLALIYTYNSRFKLARYWY